MSLTRSFEIAALLLLFVLPVTSVSAYTLTGTSTKCLPTNPNSTFSVLNSVWGTSSTPNEAGPGDQNVPMTVTLQYFGQCAANGVFSTLLLPDGFTDIHGARSATASANAIGANGSIFSITFNVNIGQGVRTGLYSMGLSLLWSSGDILNLYELTHTTIQLNGKVKLNYTTSDSLLVPGQINRLMLQLANTGSGNATNITQTMSAPTTSLLGQLSEVSRLNAGSSASLPVQMFVPAADAGSAVGLTLSATYDDGYGNSHTISQTLGFQVNTTLASQLDFSVTALTLKGGQANGVVLTVKNGGSTALSGLSISAAAQAPLDVIGGDGNYYLGTIQPGQESTIPLTIFVSQSQLQTGSISLTYSATSANAPTTGTRMITFMLDNPSPTYSPVGLQVSPTTLASGMENNVTVLLSNNGPAALSSLSVSFSLAGGQATWLQPALFQVPSLAAGENTSIPAQVYIPAAGGSSSALQASISYVVNGTDHQESRSLGLLLKGAIVMEATEITVLPQQPYPGGLLSLTVTLTNVGTIAASSVTVVPQVPSGFAMSGTRSVFVGDVQVSTPTTFTVNLQVQNSTRAGSYVIPLQLNYYDNLRDSLTATVNVPVTVSSAPPTAQTTTAPKTAVGTNLVLEVVIAAVAVVAGFAIGRRRPAAR